MPTSLSRRGALRLGAAAAGLGTAWAASGCSPGSDRGAMQFWQFYAPISQNDPVLVAQSDWFLTLARRWERAGERPIRMVYIPGYTDPTNTRLTTAFAAGDGPDIFLISPGDFLRYYNGGVLTDLTPYLSQEVVDDFYPEALATRTVDGRIYGLPMEQGPMAVYYNIPAFEDAGLAEGDLPRTWEDMLELGRRLTGGQQAGLVLDTTASYYQNFTFYPWVWQGGGDVIDRRTGQAVFDSPAAVQALRLFHDAVRTGASPRTLPAGGDMVGAFTNGYAAMWHNVIGQVEAMRRNAPDHPYGIFPLPLPPGGHERTILGGWAWVVNRHGRDPEAAARFTVEVMGSMSRESVQAAAEWDGVAKGIMPARRSVTEAIGNTGAFANPILQQFRDELLPTGRAEPRYPPVVYKAVSNAIQKTMLAGADPQQQAEIAQETIVSYLQTYDGGSLV
ncbi:ABC transporter substrate-binding protein [Georgenia deserti]|uniref:ABC transporter substrate-binding protein n=1 Tax=Georgenia deserti TaxID=2093781 RepID=A0ABW4L561_9MICO